MTPEASHKNDEIRDAVRNGYAKIAKGSGGCCGASDPEQLARAIGYSDDDIAALPDGANLGLSCGNPTSLAQLTPGQIVLDLGSGAGFDVFIAAGKVAPNGRAIGVDMTAEMLSRARVAIPAFTKKTGLSNVEFRLGEIEHLPVSDSSIDVVISNCVINLSADKQQVWREIARVLKPGGKACVSDLALRAELPHELRSGVESLIGCIAGAVAVEQTMEMCRAAGLEISATEKQYNMDVLDDCNDALYQELRRALPEGKRLSDYVASVDFVAYKPKD